MIVRTNESRRLFSWFRVAAVWLADRFGWLTFADSRLVQRYLKSAQTGHVHSEQLVGEPKPVAIDDILYFDVAGVRQMLETVFETVQKMTQSPEIEKREDLRKELDRVLVQVRDVRDENAKIQREILEFYNIAELKGANKSIVVDSDLRKQLIIALNVDVVCSMQSRAVKTAALNKALAQLVERNAPSKLEFN